MSKGAYQRIALRVAAVAADTLYCQLKNKNSTGAFRNATMNNFKVREIGVQLRTAVATDLGLIFSLTVGTASTEKDLVVTQLSDSLGTSFDQATLETAWSVAPTKEAVAADCNWLADVSLPATIGSSVSWEFDDDSELYLPALAGVQLWNKSAGAGAALTVTAVVETTAARSY
jgi:hypothetical protein